MFYKTEKLAVLIDGQSFYGAAKSLGIETDFKKLRTYFQERGHMIALKYYTMVRDEEESGLIPVLDFMSYNGYTVHSKFYKEFETDGRVYTKGSIAVDLALDMVDLSKNVDHIMLFTGSGDLVPAVLRAQSNGCRVTIGSTLQNGSMLSDELRRVSNNFIEMNALAPHIQREIASAPTKEVSRRKLQDA